MAMDHLPEFERRQSYPLDDFQRRGARALEEGRGVLVCAPTGAGKTVVGEFAVSLALAHGTKCFYTTPIKALSNQKFHDFQDTYGEDAIGLLTGDQSINADADVVVMTTEVLRNMLYASSPALERLSYVVMDEIHYLADRSRGPVWEEVILNLPESVSVVGLSATVSNSEEFGRWLNAVRGDTDVIVAEDRPVPLNQWMLVGTRVHPMFEPGTTDANGVGGELSEELVRAVAKAGASIDGQRSEARYERRGGKHNPRRDRARGAKPAGRPEIVRALEQASMLPAIFFVFSRSGCDKALFQCARSRLSLTTKAEAAEIGRIVDEGVAGIDEADLEVLGFRAWKGALMRGFAAHHAGLLPAFRHIVEELFVKGLVRVVFATETLALGINMPARSVVLERLVKFNGETHADLTPAEYTQLTGRAGRRGIDEVGHAVVQWSPGLDVEAAAGLASTRTYPLVSTFQPGYNMSINLLGTLGFERGIELLEESFAQFQADGTVVDRAREIDRKTAEANEREVDLDRQVAAAGLPGDDPAALLVEYSDIRVRLSKEEKRHRRAANEEHRKEITRLLAKLQLGDVVALPTQKRPSLAVVVKPAGRPDDPRPLIVTEAGWTGRVGTRELSAAPQRLGHMRLPRGISRNPRGQKRYITGVFKRQSFGRPKKMRTRPRVRPSAEAKALREELRNHPAHSWPANHRERLTRPAEQLVRLRADIADLERRQAEHSDTLARKFRRILGLLESLGYVEGGEEPRATEDGERLARIHSSLDLVVAECLKRGVWDGLDPAELAGVVSLCSFENRKASDGVPQAAGEAMAEAMSRTVEVWQEIAAQEDSRRLPASPAPDSAFALALHQWTAGAPLDYCLAAARECGAELTPGDFVRWCRQAVDLLEQVAATAYAPETRRRARQAIDAIRRGVVAIGH